ncbi:MAG: hypothetical protein ACK4SG_05005 [Thermomonas sp.]
MTSPPAMFVMKTHPMRQDIHPCGAVGIGCRGGVTRRARMVNNLFLVYNQCESSIPQCSIHPAHCPAKEAME